MGKPTAGRKLCVIPATRSMAQVEQTLRSAQLQPLLPHGVLDKLIEENKQDLYEKWIGGHLAALRTAIDEGDASSIAEDNVFDRVWETLHRRPTPR
jgi:hypothetical protein